MMSSKQVAKNVKVLQTVRAHASDVTCLEFWSNQLFTGSGWVGIALLFRLCLCFCVCVLAIGRNDEASDYY